MSPFFQRVRELSAQYGKYLVGLVVVLVIAAIGAVVVSPAPSAQGALKGHTVEISRNGSIRIIFTQPMNHTSVEKAFQISPVIEGTFVWEGRILSFVPKNGFEKGQTYTVTIHKQAKGILFKELTEDYRQTFTIGDYPEISVVAPVDKTIISQDQTLTVLFDRPLRILTANLDVPAFLQIAPAVSGKYHWLGTSGFEFVPDNGWPAATPFTVKIPAGTKVADGGSLIQDKIWSFSTPPLTVAFPGVYQHQKTREPVSLSFNYPVHPDAIAKDLIIMVGDTRLSNQDFSFSVNKDNPLLVDVLRKDDFELGKTYVFKLPKDAKLGVGLLGLENEWQDSVVMDELGVRLIKTSPKEGGNKTVDDSVGFCFNNPLDASTTKLGIEVSPAIEDVDISPYAYLPDGCPNNDATLSVHGRWKPSTDYTITLKTSVADIYGQKLAQPIVLHFKTDPYRPSFSLSTYGIYGVLASHLPRLYQLRTINWTGPVSVSVDATDFLGFVQGNNTQTFKGRKDLDTNASLNTAKINDLDLDQIAGQPLPNGYYRLSFNGHVPDNTQARNLIITDTALTVKRDNAGKMLVWATDIKTGQVVPNLTVRAWAPVTDYDRSAIKKIAEAKTDAQGLASLIVNEKNQPQNVIIEATEGTHVGYVETDWNQGISVWNYNLERNYDRESKHYLGYLYTERRIYRPDQQVFFKGVVRLDEDARLSLPTVPKVQVNIEDGLGNQVYSQSLPLNSYGTFNGTMQLDPAMKLGTYRMSAIVDTNDTEPKPIESYFDVREYRRPDFKVDATAPATTVFAGQQIQVPIQSAYYYGTPLKAAKVSYEVTRTKLFFQPMQGNWWNDWYSFTSDDGGECYWYCPTTGGYESVQSGTGVLDDNGNYTLNLPANLTDYKDSATYSVDVTVTDVNQRTVSSHLDFPVYRGQYYVGIRANYSAGWSASTADFDITSVNVDGSVHPNTATTIKLYKRVWSNSGKIGIDGNTVYDWQKTDTLVDTKSVTTGNDGKGRVSFNVTQDGEYVAVVESRDEKGQNISASVTRYVYRGTGGVVRVSDDHQMTIVQSKASYEVGETASLAVQTPYDATKALVTIERNSIREYRVIDLTASKRTIDIQIKEADIPNIYVSVMAVKGGGDKGLPEFRLGYANLQVNTTKKILTMTVTPDREVHRPGEPVTLTVETKNSAGAPVQAEVSLAVVDERVIALLGNIDKDILGKFWFPRFIGVDTAQSLTMLVKKVFFSPTEGGGGGKGDGGGPAVRGNFKDTAYWNATVTTGADGKARVTFNLPDNLTSWNVLAIAETKNTEVGHAETKLITRRELMAEPLLPRILRRQDTATIGATVVNATDQVIDAQVDLKAEGVTITDAGTRKVRIAAQSRTVVRWNVQVPLTGSSQAKFTVTARGSNYNDGFEQTLPILDYSVPETVSASGILEKNVTEQLQIPDNIVPNVGQVDISVQPNIGNGLQAGVTYLNDYPYACSEQKTSALLANLMYEQLVVLKATTGTPAMVAATKQRVNDSIKLLVSTQSQNGGWSFWGGDETYRTYPWLTAYVMWGLTQAQKAGFQVDVAVLDRADGYLRDSLRGTYDSVYPLSDPEKAQVIFMLSERSTKDLSGYASTLYERRDKLPEFAKLFLAMAYSNLDGQITSVRATQLLNDVKNKVVYLNPSTAYVKDEPGYEDLLSSDLRTTSVYLQALLRLDKKNLDVERVVRYLVQNRHDGYWYDTHSTSLTLLGLVEYVRANPVDQTAAQVSLYLDNQLKQSLIFAQGDVSAAQSVVLPISALSKTGDDHQIGLEKDSDKRYFYDINMRVTRAIQDIEPFDNGMTVVADAYALTDTKHERPITQASQGDNVQIRVKVVVPKRRRFVSLEYHLPAGLEGVDFQLKTSPQNIAGKDEQCYPDWDGKQRCLSDGEMNWWWQNVWQHVEYRDDRVYLFAENLEPGVYEYSFVAQATTPGEYRVPPTRIYESYNPTANGHNEGKIFRVIAK